MSIQTLDDDSGRSEGRNGRVELPTPLNGLDVESGTQSERGRGSFGA